MPWQSGHASFSYDESGWFDSSRHDHRVFAFIAQSVQSNGLISHGFPVRAWMDAPVFFSIVRWQSIYAPVCKTGPGG